MLGQTSPGDVEIPGPAIHREIPFLSRCRLEGHNRGEQTRYVEPLGHQIGVHLARYGPRQQRYAKSEALIIREVPVGAPKVVPGLRQDRREAPARWQRFYRSSAPRAGLQETQAAAVDILFEQL